MRRIAVPAALMLPLTLSLAGLTGCHTEDTRVNNVGGTAKTAVARNGVYCTVMADAVSRRSNVAAGTNAMVAPGRFRCDRPGADSLTITVSLQRWDATTGVWVTMNSVTAAAKGADTTRSRSDNSRTRSVSMPCASGSYRTAVTAVRVSSGKTKKYNMQTRPTADPCTRLAAH